MSTEHDFTQSNIGNSIVNQSKDQIDVHHVIDKPCGCNSKGTNCGCNTMSKNMPESFVYSIGKIEWLCPNRSIDKEIDQAAGRLKPSEIKGMTREEVRLKTITDPNNRYLARQLCYIFKIEGIESFILIPVDPLDIDRLVRSLVALPGRFGDIDVIVGKMGPLASPHVCNGHMLPMVAVDQIYSFDREALVKSIPKKKVENENQFENTAETLFNHIIQIADNAGITDEHRAINYLSVRFDEIYHKTQEMQDEDFWFNGIETRISRLSISRKIVDVILNYENRKNRVIRRWFVRVDVTEEFPFLASEMQEFYER
ncbi:MAG: hypothetical protein AB7U98_01355 [Candidatus Nitrosocosmicus sp.]